MIFISRFYLMIVEFLRFKFEWKFETIGDTEKSS